MIDSNIWISALFFGGMPEQVIKKAVREGGIIAICAEIEAEVREVAARKFKQRLSVIMPYFSILLQEALQTPIHNTVKVCRDPKDNMVLECAKNAAASLIITGDKDLLALGSFEGIRIVTAHEYVGDSPASAAQQ